MTAGFATFAPVGIRLPCHHPFVGIVIELLDASDMAISLADPSGGTFNAAGDFDRFFIWGSTPVMGKVSTEGRTEISSSDMKALIEEIDLLLPSSKEGPENRGLLRLRTLATYCAHQPGTRMVFLGD